MDLLKLRIPLDFLLAKLGQPSWSAVLFGVENELLAREAVSQLAAKQLEQPDEARALVDLASQNDSASVIHLVKELATSEPREPPELIAEKWLYLTLAWLFERRDELDDPLRCVEIAYADFGYPQRIATLVRYMPSDEPDLGDRKANEERLLRRWETFLVEEQARLRGQST